MSKTTHIYIHIHSIPRINLKASIFTRTWILNAIFWVYFSCSHLGLAQSRNFGPWGMIYTALTLWLHLTFECQRWFDDCTYVFLFSPYVPTCSNMFHMTLAFTCINLKGFHSCGKPGTMRSGKRRAICGKPGTWTQRGRMAACPGTRPFDVNVFHGKSEKSHG